MAKEYIERTEIYETVCKGCTRHGDASGICYADELCEKLHNAFVSAPAADVVEVKHGCWVGTADGYADGELAYDMWECSECGYDADGADEKPNWNYCPNCGADMRERRDDNAAD